MKILALTDLSPFSKVGLTFAARLSASFKAQLIVMNVFQIDQLTHTRSDFTNDDAIVKSRIKERESECAQLVDELRLNIPGDYKIEYSVETGGPFEETVNTFARYHRCDLIVMGTKGATGLKKALLGSNAAAVILKSLIPVLTVPEFAVCKGVNDVVYASDLTRLSDEFALLLPLVKKFNATIHVLHINQAENNPRTDEKTLAENLRKEFDYEKITCHYVTDPDVKSGIDQFLKVQKADVLAMFSGKRNFYERIFQKSSSREMVFQSTVPLLTFKK